MSSDQDKNPATAKITGDELIWDRAESGKDTRVFNEWIGLPTTGEVSETTNSTAENRPHPTAGCLGPWEIFVPKEGHYGIWEKSPNKERHVSFGDNGTTASANGVGDLIQISQYLGAGRSGVFTIDQCSTPEPYFVSSRARALQDLSTSWDDFSFGLFIPEELCPDWAQLPEERWVNWRWPRYEYCPESASGNKIKVCFQYMVHEGVVLQQFTLENAGETSVELDPSEFKCAPDHLIRDLDFLDGSYSFNEVNKDDESYSFIPGPNGYSRVCVHVQKENSKAEDEGEGEGHKPLVEALAAALDHEASDAQNQPATPVSSNTVPHLANGQSCRVASVITVFVNGAARELQRWDNLLEGHEKQLHGKGTSNSGGNKLQIVIAYKLIRLPCDRSSWKNFVISAEAANINHWLREEEKNMWAENVDATDTALCLVGLPISESKDTDFYAAHGSDTSPGKSMEVSTAPSSDGPPKFSMPIGTPGTASPKDHLEYFARRHLEHLLSACAIPLSTTKLIGEVGSSGASGEPEELSLPVALTCGDISGHRISTSASFFAFQFLVDVVCRLQLLSEKQKAGYYASVENRIRKTCTGHIIWLDSVRDREKPKELPKYTAWIGERTRNQDMTQAGCFAANYWVTGNIMTEDSGTWQPQNSITDTALNILKLVRYKKLGSKGVDWERAERLLDDIYVPWLTGLNRLDIRETYSWPHRDIHTIKTFRLDDHFWIWKALKSLHAEASKVPQPSSRYTPKTALKSAHQFWLERLYNEQDQDSTWSIEKATEEFRAVVKRLSSSSVQRGILQRFTTENDVSRKRMLALTRSARDTRFLLHARDAALFYDEDCGNFFQESAFEQLWVNTIDAQLYHDDNMEEGWDKALRYALGVAMGTRNHTLDKSNATDLVKRCVDILISSSGPDAFFSGQLDEGGKGPIIFDNEMHRDFFYHSGFEIHYVLFSNARNIDGLFRASDGSRSGEVHHADMASKTSGDIRSILAGVLLDVLEHSGDEKISKEAAEHNANLIRTANNATRVFGSQPNMSMKKFLPFTNVIFATDVKPIGDEWLYKYPDFLRGVKIGLKDIVAFISQDSPSEPFMDAGAIVSKAIQDLQQADPPVNPDSKALIDYSCLSASYSETPPPERNGSHPAVFDTKKKKRLGKRQKDALLSEEYNRVSSPGKLLEHLGKPRTAWTAKKRFIWLPCANPATAFVCYVASPDREKHAISRFFDRHARYDKDIWDTTSMVFNEWQTELHLSFYVLAEKSEKPWPGLPDWEEKPMPFPGNSSQVIRRASMSFRFDGDFFDRYWTCHFIEFAPQSGPSKDSFSNWSLPKELWQRKVLELYFLNRIMTKILGASQEFLTKIRETLGISQKGLAFTKLFTNENLASESMKDMKRWKEYEQVLQMMEEDLTSISDELRKWNRREAERGEEKPRWTPNDEKKYRTTINKLRGTSERATTELQAIRGAMRKFRDFLALNRKNLKDELDRERSEQERRQDGNIRYFTYITVIFQPLSFAAGFYSMGGAPENALIISLAEFAAAAFAVTLILVWISRPLFKSFGQVRTWIARLRETGPAKSPLERIIPARIAVHAYLRAQSVLKGNEISLQLVVHVLLVVPAFVILALHWFTGAFFAAIFIFYQLWIRLYKGSFTIKSAQRDDTLPPAELSIVEEDEKKRINDAKRIEKRIHDIVESPQSWGLSGQDQRGSSPGKKGEDWDRDKIQMSDTPEE